MTTVVPVAIKLNITIIKFKIWLLTPTAATLLSEYWLSISVSALPINIYNETSIKIGQVSENNENDLSAGFFKAVDLKTACFIVSNPFRK